MGRLIESRQGEQQLLQTVLRGMEAVSSGNQDIFKILHLPMATPDEPGIVITIQMEKK